MNESYYYVNDGKSVGPYSLEELMKQPITPNTFVWTKGLVNWEKQMDFILDYHSSFLSII